MTDYDKVHFWGACSQRRTVHGRLPHNCWIAAPHDGGKCVWCGESTPMESKHATSTALEPLASPEPARGTEPSTPAKNTYGEFKRGGGIFHGDRGGASRFFYCAKVTSREREAGLREYSDLEARMFAQSGGENAAATNGDDYEAAQSIGLDRVKRVLNHHPTLKPVSLMAWLVRLITPPGGLVLDPFAGSGSTGVAATREGFAFIGIEQNAEFVAIARARIGGDAPLFNFRTEATA